MRRMILAVFILALSVMIGCKDDDPKGLSSAVGVGKCLGYISGNSFHNRVYIYEHEGNLIYVHGNNSIAVVQKGDAR